MNVNLMGDIQKSINESREILRQAKWGKNIEVKIPILVPTDVEGVYEVWFSCIIEGHPQFMHVTPSGQTIWVDAFDAENF